MLNVLLIIVFFIRVTAAEVCDARDDAQGYAAGNKINYSNL